MDTITLGVFLLGQAGLQAMSLGGLWMILRSVFPKKG